MPDASLPPDLASVIDARRLVQQTLSAWGIAGAPAEDALLVVSELVTNAILHAGTEMVVSVERRRTRLRLAVADGSDRPAIEPLPEPGPDPTAEVFDDPGDLDLDRLLESLPTTGRGLKMVQALTVGWGNEPTPEGKRVWAEIGLDTTSREPPEEPPAGVASGPRGVQRANAGLRSLPLCLVAVPLRLLLEAHQEFDAVARELRVIELSDSADTEARQVAAELSSSLQDMTDLRTWAAATIRDARRRGDQVIDLIFDQGEGLLAIAREIADLGGRIAEARQRQVLLTPAPSDEVAAFRRWFLEEVERQVDGAAPAPCPFPVIPPGATPAPEERARLARRRQELLAALEGELRPVDTEQVLVDRILDWTRHQLRANFAALYVAEPGGARCLGRTGSQEDADTWARYSSDAENPSAEAVRTGRPVLVRSRAERRALFPDMPLTEAAHENPALVTVPIPSEGPAPAGAEADGSISLGFTVARSFSDDDLLFLDSIAGVVGRALRRCTR
jgi:anti-sigma regulatory factor (Ser/Thr protein kinase)